MAYDPKKIYNYVLFQLNWHKLLTPNDSELLNQSVQSFYLYGLSTSTFKSKLKSTTIIFSELVKNIFTYAISHAMQ